MYTHGQRSAIGVNHRVNMSIVLAYFLSNSAVSIKCQMEEEKNRQFESGSANVNRAHQWFEGKQRRRGLNKYSEKAENEKEKG